MLPAAGAVVQERDVVPVHRELTFVALRAIISDADAVAGAAANAAATMLRAIRKRMIPLVGSLDWAVRSLHRRKVAELNADG